MFGKLKEKLKQAVSIFSKKTEEEAQIESTPIEEKKEVIEQKKESRILAEQEKKKKITESKKGKTAEKKQGKKEKIQKQKIIPEPQNKAKLVEAEKTKTEPKKEEIKFSEVRNIPGPEIPREIEEKSPEPKEEPPKQNSFFKKLFGKKEEAKEAFEEKAAKDYASEPKIEIVESKKVQAEDKESFFGKVKTSLTTKRISAEKFDELFWELELALLENNVSLEVIEKIKEDLKTELVDKPLPRDVTAKIEETLKQTLTEILSFEKIDLIAKINEKKGPYIIAFFGINGTGKTTSIAKITHYFQKYNLPVVLAACDTFRAAAIQQLEEHADKLGVKIIKQDYGSDAAAVAFDAIKYAEKNKIKVVLLDTAGRLHSNTNLMQELGKIIRVAKPDLKIFVGESITGNDCLEQAKKFNDLVEMDGAILTKADVDEKGGAPLSISYTIKKPILFLGMGQRYEDLEEFDAQKILQRLGF